MNYLITRIILLTFILIILIILRKKYKDRSDKHINLNIRIILFFVILFSILFVPFENLFVKYKTIEDNVNYFFPKYEIKKKFIYDDYVYLLLKNDKEIVFTYLIKDNDSWKLNNLFTRNQGNFSRIKYNILVAKTNISKRKSKAVIIISDLTSTEKNKITDSISSEIYTYTNPNNSGFTKTYINIIILNGRINEEEYTIYINDEEYKPFKKVKTIKKKETLIL